MISSIAVDSSVIVKWFKKGEEYEREAIRFRDDVLSSNIDVVMCEWVFLEVCRSLVKAGFSERKVNEAYEVLKRMSELGFIKVFPVSLLLNRAVELEIGLKLYASDALHLALAVEKSIDLLTEDRHLLRQEVKDYVSEKGLKILRLSDLY